MKEGLGDILERKFTRRDFLKYSSSLVALLGLSQAYVPKVAQALENVTSDKLPIIWLHGAGCSGCTVSIANSRHPTIAELILDTLSLKYHETLMAGSGEVAERALDDTLKRFWGKYVMVVEGAIPTKDGGIYCKVGGRPFVEIVEEVAEGAAYRVALGTCASFGGVPAADPNPTGCKGLKDVVGGTVVNIPGCPAHPDWLVATIVNILLYGKVPKLDEHGRPLMNYGKLIHENCPRRGGYEQGRFIKNFGEELPDIEGCLGAKGCRGPVTYADCPHRLWNSGVNFCIAAGAPCVGCVEPTFPSPSLFEPLPEVAKVAEAAATEKTRIGAFGASVAGAVAGAAVAAGAFYLKREKSEQREGEK